MQNEAVLLTPECVGISHTDCTPHSPIQPVRAAACTLMSPQQVWVLQCRDPILRTTDPDNTPFSKEEPGYIL